MWQIRFRRCDNVLTHLCLVLKMSNIQHKGTLIMQIENLFSFIQYFTVELLCFAALATDPCTSGTGGVNEASWSEALTAAAVFGEMGTC